MSKKKDKNDIKKVDEVEDVEKVESSEPENSELIECKKRVEELESIAKRALADYQNLEKRVREEKRGWILSTNRQLILRLLPVLDILVMASQHVDNQGLQLSIKQFGDVLRNESVERIETVGKDFDPTLMECVVTEKGEEGKVLSEIQAGYKMGDKVLRPAQVKVGKS
ncbi:MAG: nucleotide exchange factor GrpE [Candidatus Levybacteria bacterium RIFCSPHIGHO2_02_FULL_37_18]|nr:MAG: nucleotide exchange factor GrpE [Candidatus Levybacteria bacterium RIFCSPHIGHO2_01_FULL_38_12]OGH22007.1 MAG: nucleotide exchange factor GrpE [Candidatus Levybacteria bacterium RIFCSPHIGHO2_02_FULL_37_18]OGH33700.1 MAG: nucleotide exchange factor GrpE [Candidatus Levybacteria bacterium RIFCSPLOWO2_01_FULL_37_20]OGH44606.1 MAG: nucleotide exchange factor GrpE [Candidatus Levybacteria bacterium RIFCSPLOWO2_02_FULL_37_18]OGH51678.1 MAG: nucleotide exchange factor GrpE [Candidatus Levybacte